MVAILSKAHGRIAPLLLRWYDSHARQLPWRIGPDDGAKADPYRVWLSEVMLQQTTTAAVAPYFARFTEKWRDIHALAAAPEADVMAAWAGLGYYSRARNLVACARQVSAMGSFPETEEELRKLPGIGDYTAAAIAAIAFGKRAVVIDANIERVVARLFAIEEALPAGKKPIRISADQITPDQRSGDFAQGMMDLGASLCTARIAKCDLCPLEELCVGKAKGIAETLPVKPPKKAKPARKGSAFWIERDGKVLLVTRVPSGMLGGMRALSDDGWSAKGDGSGEAPFSGDWQIRGVVRHVFTHFSLELSVMACSAPASAKLPKGEWVLVDQAETAGLPTLFAKAARLVMAQKEAG